ncbi:GATOR complex protein WDR59-like isoform X2 [Gigantopelta aegis]|uniref:GATOR complex protein WDR59-like isoform X2 n=1 Tax=Gigantopelta aegis TaxID=1735272 RepID=UPI001B889A83|nr:GATOR complex protein WDR59-like isoform X2 [Gigantopelta aegis]
MAVRWSSEQVVAEYKDLQANAMAVDCLGQYALLAGRRTLALVDLSHPTENVIKVNRQSKWDVNCIQYNPHACQAETYVTASNQRLDVSSWVNGGITNKCSLKAHTRTVSDVDWSPFDVNVIASCSVDTFIYLWDIRDPKKPTSSFQAVAGAYQVKWNKVTNNLFATTHEGDLRIWDPRKGNQPLQYITAHLSKIHGLDWSPRSQYHLVTASQDCFVRFWDCTNPRHSETMLKTNAPVWRARYTPFGDGLVTVVVPQLKPVENRLYLWYNGNLSMPMHTFLGHKDVVLEFQWRKMADGFRDRLLVTWSRDQSLRIWKIDPNLQELCGHNPVGDLNTESSDGQDSVSKSADSHVVAEEAKLQTEVAMTSHKPQTLQQEFSLINKNINNVTIEEMDAINRTCKVTARSGNHVVSVNLTFPTNYPNGTPPSFQFLHTTLESSQQKQLIRVLTSTSQKQVQRKMNCLEPCLRQLIAALDDMTKLERKSPDSVASFNIQQSPAVIPSANFLPMYSISSFQDSSVPFPRTSGARFCSVGKLVVFQRPAEMKKIASGEEVTPKSLSELTVYGEGTRIKSAQVLFSQSPPSTSADSFSVSDFYTYKEKKPRSRSKTKLREASETKLRDADKSSKKPTKAGPLKIYDMSCLLPVNRQLAENYILDLYDIPKMCSHNAAAAAAVGRKDLSQIWSQVSVMSSKELLADDDPDKGPPWASLQFGRPLLKDILDHYTSLFDVQTLAMLCCVFWQKDDSPKPSQRTSSKSSMDYVPANYNPYHTVSSASLLKSFKLKGHTHPSAPTNTGAGPMSEVASHPNLYALFKHQVMKNKRSNSWSESYDNDYQMCEEKDPAERAAEKEREAHRLQWRMLDPAYSNQYDIFKKVYASLLYYWGLPNKSAHILKYTAGAPDPHKGIDFAVICHRCSHEVRETKCRNCTYTALRCAICHMGVRGSANFCVACGHGGHAKHIRDWFQNEAVCPTGCGCNCLTVQLISV